MNDKDNIVAALTDRTIKRLCIVNGVLAVILGAVSLFGLKRSGQ